MGPFYMTHVAEPAPPSGEVRGVKLSATVRSLSSQGLKDPPGSTLIRHVTASA